MLRVLPDGKVQIIGGASDRSIEIYDPADDSFGAHAKVLNGSNTAGDVLNTQTRGALLYKGSTLNNPALDPLLNRGNYSLTELPQRNGAYEALVGGGLDSGNVILNSAYLLGSSQASVTTDKLDYAPGEPVTFSGAGWQPNELVDMVLHEEPNTGAPDIPLQVQADPQGKFTFNAFAPSQYQVGVTFTLTAWGASSGYTAQTAFTDARQFTAVITPTSATAGVATSYTLTVTNTSTATMGGQSMDCVQITIPSGATSVNTLSVVANDPGPIARTWTSPTVSGSTIETKRSGGTANSIDETTGTVAVTFKATSTAGSKTWTASAFGNTNCSSQSFALQTGASQPVVTVAAANIAPIINKTNASVTVNEGQAAANTGTWSDANAGDTVTLSASVGTVTKSGTNASGTWSWSFPTTDGTDQSQTVTITANDGNGGISTTTFSLTVNNVAPTIALTGATNINEGSLYTLNLGTVTDPGTDTVSSYTIHWGDGASDPVVIGSPT
ncbi:MAG: Ig-like domain-containing protein, partial [Gemmatimonadales bacterium]